MSNKEQRILEQDSSNIHHKAQIADRILSNAIRNGIKEGKKREMKRHLIYYGVGIVTTVVAAVLFFTMSPMTAPLVKERYEVIQTTNTERPIDLELFRSASRKDNQAIEVALDQGLVKPINRSVEKDGLRIDIAGAFADGRKVYVMYSVTNNTDYAAMPHIDSLAFGNIEASSFRAETISTKNSSNLRPKETGYYVYTANLVPSESYTSGATLNLKNWVPDLNEYQNEMQFTIPLEPNLLEEKDRIYDPQSTLLVDGQKINVTKVQFTPLYTYVDLEYDASNTQQIFTLLDPVLIGEKGDQRDKVYYPSTIKFLLDSQETDDSKVTLVFNNNQFDQMDTVSLKVSGIAALPKDQMSISIDLKQTKIVKSPIKNLQIIKSVADGEISLHYSTKTIITPELFSMWLEDSFTDAKGNKHTILPSENITNSGTSWSNKEGTIEENYARNFGKEALDYPQPLTIGIKKYWNPIMDSQSVTLISHD